MTDLTIPLFIANDDPMKARLGLGLEIGIS